MLKRFIAVLFSAFILFSSCGGGSSSSTFEVTGDKNYVSPKNVVATDAKNQSENLEKEWWKKTSFYHIWVKSFYDSNGDGIGDLNGIKEKLDYIADLGFAGIWLSPIFECDYKGDNMHGYDVKDYYAVNSSFGTEHDLEELIKACHKKGIKIIFDYVPNHTGSGNQWFKDSCNNSNGKRDWYVWNNISLNWNTGMSMSGWTKNGGAYYWHAFAGSQPDLNFRNYEVREEMKNVVRYWLNKGFDGLRIDAVRYIVEDGNTAVDSAENIVWLSELRKELDSYASPKFMTLEAWITNNRNTLNKYFGSSESPAANMLLDFDQGTGILNSVSVGLPSKAKESLFENPNNCAYGTFLANHDEYNPRIGTAFSGDNAKINLATALSLSRPTVPFVYYGQEIAMKEDTSAGSGDIRLRRNFTWSDAETQMTNSTSTYSLNKALLHLRKELPNLFAYGKVEYLETAQKFGDSKVDKVLAYTLSDEKDTLLCVANLSKYQWTEYKFSNGVSNDFVLLVGRSGDKGFSSTESASTFTNLYPYEMRIYYSGKTLINPKMIFTESYLTEGVKFEGEIAPENVFYLRGSMNNWGLTEMNYDSASQKWSVKVNLSGSCSFKLDKGGEWKTAYGYSKNDMKNATVNLNEEKKIFIADGQGTTNLEFNATSSGEYIFTFDEKTGMLKISK